MEKFWKILGYIWTLPITLIGLVYVLAFSFVGWYRWTGVVGDALVWNINLDKLPPRPAKFWTKWSGHTFGQVVVLKYTLDTEKGKVLLIHETEHVHQHMKLGVFMPLMFSIVYLSIKFGCESADPFLDNSFEISARRRAGQVVDVIGALRKLREQHHTH